MTKQTFVQCGVGVALMAAVVACDGSSPLNPSVSDPFDGASAIVSPAPLALVGSWQLVSATPTGEAPVNPSEPERFTAEFAANGRVSLRADCNRCSGGYIATTGALTVSPMACTRAYCSSAPLDTTFTMLVGQSTVWTASNGSLELRGDSGVLRLRK
ncbi:MAG TPA: META domain-containing protein [Vicinamibacteria bacterium]|nr:META domain-containing protein [Vicinamibacteria bacterium]